MLETTILSEEQTANAVMWYNKNREYVESFIRKASFSYPPDDKMNPALWKAEHWNWFTSDLTA